MPNDDFDRALIDAWEQTRQRFKDDPDKLGRVLRRRAMSTYARPLRSWSLVLRAGDKRIPDDNTQGVVQLTADRVRAWCSPVVIDYPGVSLDEAARRFGVNRTTVSRWASPSGMSWAQAVKQQLAEAGDDARFGRPGVVRVVGKRLMLEHEHNRANPKRSATRVWTPTARGVDPGGAVWSPGWGELRVGLAGRVPAGFRQALERVDRRLGRDEDKASSRSGPATRVFQWVCPPDAGGCGGRVYKVYLPMPAWTLCRALGAVADDLPACPADGEPRAFLCHRCAGLIYESAERTASPGKCAHGRRRRINPMDRLVKRLSAGALSAADVRVADDT
jgi:hypothetical protein